MDLEQIEALERVARLMEQGVLSESEAYEARLEILGDPSAVAPVETLGNLRDETSAEDEQPTNRGAAPRWVTIIVLLLIAGGIGAGIWFQRGGETARELRMFTDAELQHALEHLDTPNKLSKPSDFGVSTERYLERSGGFCDGPEGDRIALNNGLKANANAEWYSDSSIENRWWRLRLRQFASESGARKFLRDIDNATSCGSWTSEGIEGEDVDSFLQPEWDGEIWIIEDACDLRVGIAPETSDDTLSVACVKAIETQDSMYGKQFHIFRLYERHGNLVISLTSWESCCLYGFRNSDESPRKASVPADTAEDLLDEFRDDIFSELEQLDLTGGNADT